MHIALGRFKYVGVTKRVVKYDPRTKDVYPRFGFMKRGTISTIGFFGPIQLTIIRGRKG